jgi:hypothetical protein
MPFKDFIVSYKISDSRMDAGTMTLGSGSEDLNLYKFCFCTVMYLGPGESVHGVGADFEGQLPAVQHLVKTE